MQQAESHSSSHLSLTHGRQNEDTLSWPRRRVLWTVGVLISLALAVIPPLIGPKYVYIEVGILMGLVGVCLALLIEQALRHDETSVEIDSRLRAHADKTADAINQIHPIAFASQECRNVVAQIVRSWMQIDERNYPAVFSSMRHTRAVELSTLLAELAHGSTTVGIDGPFSVRARQFDDNVREYRAISVGPLEFWTTNFGANYLEAQHESIKKNGTEVERIFVLDDNQIATAEPIIRAQVTAGVQVWVVRRNLVPHYNRKHIADQGILTFENKERMLMQPLARGYQMADRERLSVDPGEISEAMSSQDILRQYATKLEEATPWPF